MGAAPDIICKSTPRPGNDRAKDLSETYAKILLKDLLIGNSFRQKGRLKAFHSRPSLFFFGPGSKLKRKRISGRSRILRIDRNNAIYSLDTFKELINLISK